MRHGSSQARIELLRFIDSGALQTSWALRIDTLTAEQEHYLNAWTMGTGH